MESFAGIPVSVKAEGEQASLPAGNRQVLLLLSLLGGLALLAAALSLLSPLAPPPPDPAFLRAELLILDPTEMNPEPLERFLYVTGVLLAPLCLGAAYAVLRRAALTSAGNRIFARIAPAVAWLPAPLAIALLISAGLAEGASMMGGAVLSLVAIPLGVAVIWSDRLGEKARRFLGFALIATAAVLLPAVFSFGVIGVAHIRKIPIFQASFNAFFHSVVQVYFGRALLIDFSNQYGLYPHFLEPLLKVVGLSVFSLTALTALLNVLAFACMYRFLAAETRDEVLPFLALTTLLYFGYVFGKLAESDIYLQYHPLRVLFPALSLPLALRFARSPSLPLAGALAALGAAALLWNPDSGVAVLAGALSLPCYDALARRRFGSVLTRLLGGGAVAAAVLGLFTAYLRLRYGRFPDFALLFSVPKIFYLYGMMMRPMPKFGLWVPVIAVYAVGLLRAVAALVEGGVQSRPRIYFFLCVIGLGAFAYYQGRSVSGNLLAASYPAVILLALFADEVRRRASAGRRLSDRVLLCVLAALLAFSVPVLAAVSPQWAGKLAERVRTAREGGDSGVLADIAFVRTHLRPGERIVIMSYLSGLYHLVSRTTNPLNLPGPSEIGLARDLAFLEKYGLEMRETFLVDRTAFQAAYIAALEERAPRASRSSGTLVLVPRR